MVTLKWETSVQWVCHWEMDVGYLWCVLFLLGGWSLLVLVHCTLNLSPLPILSCKGKIFIQVQRANLYGLNTVIEWVKIIDYSLILFVPGILSYSCLSNSDKSNTKGHNASFSLVGLHCIIRGTLFNLQQLIAYCIFLRRKCSSGDSIARSVGTVISSQAWKTWH